MENKNNRTFNRGFRGFSRITDARLNGLPSTYRRFKAIAYLPDEEERRNFFLEELHPSFPKDISKWLSSIASG